MRESKKDGRFTVIRIPESDYTAVRNCVLGGRGLNSAILYSLRNDIPAHWENPKNVVIIGAGPFAGSKFPSSGRTTISVLRSPVTNFWSDGNLGGYFGAALRRAGIAALVLVGKMSAPHVISINKRGLVRMHKISEERFYRLGVTACESWVENTIWGKNSKYSNVSLSIGTAGARKVFCAVPVSAERTAGGGGTGAVLGSKMIKSITIEYDPEGDSIEFQSDALESQFEKAASEAEEKIKNHPVFDMFSKYGTTSLIEIHSALDYLPVDNWEKNNDERWPEVSGQTLIKKNEEFHGKRLGMDYDKYEKKLADEHKLGCSNCPILCSNVGKIEYETLNCLGPKIGIFDLGFITTTNMVLMNDAGIDVIQSTSIIAALMNMWQDGVSLYEFNWGDKEEVFKFLEELSTNRPDGHKYETFAPYFVNGFYHGLVELIKKYNEAFFDKLALGAALEDDEVLLGRWADAKSVEDYASLIFDYYYVHSKGYGLSWVYINDKNKGVALAAATSTRGADHLRSLPTLATYADWYIGKSSWKSWIPRIWKILRTPWKAASLMQAERKNLLGDLYETYKTTFGVPAPIADAWQESGFLHDTEQTEGWGLMLKFCQEMYAVSDALGTCKFTSSWRFGVGVEMLSYALTLTGQPYYDWEKLLRVGERITALERQLRFFYSGQSYVDDIPQKFYNKNIKGCITRDRMDALLVDYYKTCGYNIGGRVTREKMNQLFNTTFLTELLNLRNIITNNPDWQEIRKGDKR